jgi:hypothetical protein
MIITRDQTMQRSCYISSLYLTVYLKTFRKLSIWEQQQYRFIMKFREQIVCRTPVYSVESLSCRLLSRILVGLRHLSTTILQSYFVWQCKTVSCFEGKPYIPSRLSNLVTAVKSRKIWLSFHVARSGEIQDEFCRRNLLESGHLED